MSLVLLAVIGVVEALVYIDRIRTAIGGSVWRSALSALLVTCTRIAFVIVGAGAVMAQTSWWWCVVCYAVPATLATVLVHPRMKGVK